MLPRKIYEQAVRDNWLAINNSNDHNKTGQYFINMTRIVIQAEQDGHKDFGKEMSSTRYFTQKYRG